MKVLIMAGGSGERFWPLSTKEFPKQFLSLIEDKSLIRLTVDRILKIVDINDVFIATNEIHVTNIKNQIPELLDENIIIEPMFKDTAAAITYGATYISKYEKNPTIIVLASDHLINKVDNFLNAIKIGSAEAVKGSIITLGIKPTRPETGYGYIQIESFEDGIPVKSLHFLEKPNLEKAMLYYNDNQYLWNSGMFIFTYDTIMKEIQTFVPNHALLINKMKYLIFKYSGFTLSNKIKPYFSKFERISIDYAVMEKSNRIKCLPVDIGWNDIGDFNSLSEIFSKDEYNNIIKNSKYIYLDSNSNIVISEEKDRLVTTIGINNMIIVDSKNGLLICPRGKSQKIKELTKMINDTDYK